MSTGTIHTPADPIAAVLDFEGGASEDYSRLCDRLHSTCAHRRLQGCLYHWMKRYPEGFRVIEFWRGRDLFERFMVEEFLPLVRELGVVEPRLTIEAVPQEVLGEPDDEDPAPAS